MLSGKRKYVRSLLLVPAWKDVEAYSNDLQVQDLPALEQLLEESEWQPIETAPKDGRFFGWVEVSYGCEMALSIQAVDGSFWSLYDDGECDHEYGSEMVQWVCGITEPRCLKCLKPQSNDWSE